MTALELASHFSQEELETMLAQMNAHGAHENAAEIRRAIAIKNEKPFDQPLEWFANILDDITDEFAPDDADDDKAVRHMVTEQVLEVAEKADSLDFVLGYLTARRTRGTDHAKVERHLGNLITLAVILQKI